jgi:uncharacterized protein YdcH (DUF465 family)
MDWNRHTLLDCLGAESSGRLAPRPIPTSPSSSTTHEPAFSAGSRVFVGRANKHSNLHSQKQEIVPMDLHHPILREFPEHREIIRRLKGASDHFRSLFDEYHRLDDEIYRIEEDIDFATDQEIEELKMRRTKLKDYIYHLVRHAPPVVAHIPEATIATHAIAAQ